MNATIALVGRHAELAQVYGLVETRTQHGGCLVLRGEAGIGKSSLLAAAADRATARGHLVVHASGVQTEATLPFAALQQVLHPMGARITALPANLRTALRGALEQLDDLAPEPYLVALATLGVLCAAATDVPVNIVIDDAHWIDPASAGVLAFVARRLQADPVVLLASIRPGYPSPLLEAQLPVLDLAGLDDAAAEELLRARSPHLDDGARADVLRYARGNPLALVELPLSPTQPAGGAPTPLLQPVTERLEHSFAQRLTGLDSRTRTALVVCAAHDRADLSEVLAAAARVLADPTVTDSVLAPAVAGGLVEIAGDRLTFRHPLVRSAIYQSATRDERRATHAALAETLCHDPERQAWHLAADVAGHDERVAAAMEQAARIAGKRGSAAVSADAWERAAALTPGRVDRARRCLHAAELAGELGQADRAMRLLRAFDPADLDVPAQARTALVRDAIDPGVPGDPGRIRTLVGLAEALVPLDRPDLTTRLLLTAAAHAWTADPGPETIQYLVTAADLLPGPPDDPLRLSVLGAADPSGHGKAIRDRAARIRPEDLDAGSSALATSVFLTGADVSLTALGAKVIDGLRATGRYRAMPAPMAMFAWRVVVTADWRTALPVADEAHRIAAETGQVMWVASAEMLQGLIAGLRGDEERALAYTAGAEAIVLPLRMNAFMCGIVFTRGLIAIGADRYDVAYTQLRRLLDPADPCFHPVQSTWGLGDLAEAAAHTGRLDEVRDLIAGYLPRQGPEVAPWTEVALAYARPFLAGDAHAEEEFERALASVLTQWPWYHARLLLAYGTWLRRRRRLVDACGRLRTARDTCDALGLRSFADRARRELRAAGEDSPSGIDAPWAALSPQELQIAQLAAAGHTNKEIAERLYLSERTVASHLYRAYPKLGIKSRAKLHTVLGRQS